MALHNFPTACGPAAETLRRSVAVGICTPIDLGLQQSGRERGPERDAIRATHGSIALAGVLLMTIRLLWRFGNPPPAHSSDLPRWQVPGATTTHRARYTLIFNFVVRNNVGLLRMTTGVD